MESMRVLQVINNLDTGGAERLLLDSIPKFIDNDIEVELLLLNGSDFPFLEMLKQKNLCKVHTLGTHSVYNPFLTFKIFKFFRQFDVLHVHLFPSLYWVSIAKMLSFSRVRLIYTEHSTSNNRRNSWLFNILDQIVYRKYAKIITISNDVDTLLRNYLKMKPSSFRIISNGVNLEKISRITPHDRTDFTSSEEKIVIQVSNFSKQKDQYTLIKAICHLKANVKLLLVGDGELKTECEALVGQLGLEDKVEFLGVRMDVIELLKMADVAVLSTHYEGLSLSSIEALACKKPLIASRVPGLSSVVEHAGILFPPGDAKALAQIIDELLSDQQLYEKTANLCYKRAQDFGLDTMIKEHIKLYKEVCPNLS
ncbi:MAG: glycosyltransferase [Bacteroidota bacterium]